MSTLLSLSTPPSALTEQQFWDTIESAWSTLDIKNLRCLLGSDDPERHLEAYCTVVYFMQPMLLRLARSLSLLPGPQLAAWKQHFKHSLDLLCYDYPGPREASKASRCFAVLVGRQYYVKLSHNFKEYVIEDPVTTGLLQVMNAIERAETGRVLEEAIQRVFSR